MSRRDRIFLRPQELTPAELNDLRDAIDTLIAECPHDNVVVRWVVRWRNEFESRKKLEQDLSCAHE
jgi:hypothetical protein